MPLNLAVMRILTNTTSESYPTPIGYTTKYTCILVEDLSIYQFFTFYQINILNCLGSQKYSA